MLGHCSGADCADGLSLSGQAFIWPLRLCLCGQRQWGVCGWLQGLNIQPASFFITAGVGANASVAGVIDVSAASTVPDLFTYVAEVAVNSSYVVGGASLTPLGSALLCKTL